MLTLRPVRWTASSAGPTAERPGNVVFGHRLGSESELSAEESVGGEVSLRSSAEALSGSVAGGGRGPGDTPEAKRAAASRKGRDPAGEIVGAEPGGSGGGCMIGGRTMAELGPAPRTVAEPSGGAGGVGGGGATPPMPVAEGLLVGGPPMSGIASVSSSASGSRLPEAGGGPPATGGAGAPIPRVWRRAECATEPGKRCEPGRS